jgi:hypothetical protein
MSELVKENDLTPMLNSGGRPYLEEFATGIIGFSKKAMLSNAEKYDCEYIVTRSLNVKNSVGRSQIGEHRLIKSVMWFSKLRTSVKTARDYKP